jgi:PIN domain nuclease of toxin-antitoxin system
MFYMIILDTCAFIFDALEPKRLSKVALRTLEKAEEEDQLYCCDITLWEVAMLIRKKRLEVGIGIAEFLHLELSARQIQTLSVLPEIAALSTESPLLKPCTDPADRLIAATTFYHRAGLITCDEKISEVAKLNIIW